MSRVAAVLSCLPILAACDAPTPGFRGADVSRHTVDGSTFAVYVKGETAQAVRTNRQFAPRIGPLAGQAAVAMQAASGCRVTRLGGDAAVLVGSLSCGGRPRAPCDVDAVLQGPRGFRAPVLRACP
ncbi:hypothetical protein [Pseudooceanicola onchidii]|uniref:hypothetical protein n=1 Tax=Pseudooceanicola onchidii TaxID=2562279 RepID=UPI00197F7D56|nr:hypothetical protein [Pseudooceanicola onchidii]